MIEAEVWRLLRTLSRTLAFIGVMHMVPAWAQGVEPPPIVSPLSPGGVNYQTGSYNLSEAPDLSIGGEGVDAGLQLARIYQSGLPSAQSTPTFRAQGWTHSLHVGLSTFQRANPRGGTDNFISVAVGNASTPFRTGSGSTSVLGPATQSGAKLTYSSSAGTYTFTDRGNNVVVFDGFRVRTWTRPSGVVLTYSYSGLMLKSIVSSIGYALLFEGNANGQWTKACVINLSQTYAAPASNCPAGAPSVTYSYSPDGLRLTGVTNALSQTTEYQYNPITATSRLTCVKRPGQTTCEITNQYLTCSLYPGVPSEPSGFHQMDRVASQTTGGGVVYTYTYSNDPYCPRAEGPYHTTMTVGGAVTKVTTNNSGAVIRIEDPLNRITSIGYPATGAWYIDPPYPSSITYPEGNRVDIEHQAGLLKLLRQVAKPGLPSPDLVSQNTFPATPCSSPATCNKPIAATDARQNVTDYSYWAHGGIWTEMPPAPVAGGARPLKVTTWVQRYAWIKDAGGSLVPNSSFPVWVKSTETLCQTVAGPSAAATCDPAAAQTVTTYEYGANGTAESLLLKGVAVTGASTTLRTCYGYDAYGRVIYETKPNANLSTCS